MIGGQAVATPSGSEQKGEPGLASGATLGRYVVIGEVGRGGMGVVYAARDPELDRRVAVKLLRAPTSGARLVREARALGRIAHPNVVTVYDVGTFEGRAFVAMELVLGESLRRWMEARARSWREAVDVFVQAGRGLAAAHAAGLVHRDFKPENVLIGHDGRVRVLDFGLVTGSLSGEEPGAPKEASLASASGRLTETGALLGTPAYMAPEQLRAEEADARTDQWSYCLSLWEAVCGARPFLGETLAELSRAVMKGALPAPPRDRQVPAWLCRALACGLAVDRDARHPSMDALLADLEAGLAREEDEARPMLPPATAPMVAPAAVARAPVAPRSRSAIALAATMLLVAVAAAYGLLVVSRAASSRSAVQDPTASGVPGAEPARTLDPAAPVVAPASATASAEPAALPTAAVRVTPSPKPARRPPPTSAASSAPASTATSKPAWRTSPL